MAPSGIFYRGDDMAISDPSIGASSMITDANSAYPNGQNLQRNTSFNSDTYRIPASPLSFSSNNANFSGSPLMGGQNININPYLQKKPRLDIKQEEIVLQQLMQRQNTQALVQQQRLRQQQHHQYLQSMPPAERAHILQMRQQIQNQTVKPVSSMKRPHDNGICSRRIMKYLYHLRQHPSENTIAYWRKFVAEYYSPRVKKRWCLSLYNNVGNHSLGVFPQANTDAWHCDICGSKCGKGFEATFDVLPRLNRIKFASGVKEEILFLDLPRESTFPSGLMMLEYGKAVEESVYEQLRVVREGQLRIIFSPDLKILSWDFCSRHHEEYLPRRLVAPQVNHLMQVAQKCVSTVSESGGEGISQQDLQTNNNMVVAAGRQLAKTLELQSLNDLGFSKTYVRCLQIAEVVGSMKKLMDICRDQKIGPIESLKTYTQHVNSSKIQMQKANDVAHVNDIVNGQMNNAQNMLMRQSSINSSNSNYNSSSTFKKTNENSTTNTQRSSYISEFNKEIQNLSLLGQSGRGNIAKDINAYPPQSRINGIKVGSNSELSPMDCIDGNDQKAPNMPQDDPLSDDMVKNIADAFIENGFLSSDFDDCIDFDWKM